MARPLAVVVAGLGEEGKLRAVDLVYTVRQAVIAYAQRLAEGESGAPAEFELAATLIGSGGTGISAGSAAQMVAQGAWEANQKLHDSGWPQVGRLILVEFYLDRASDAWRALQVQATATPNQLKVVGFVKSGAGALRRSLDSSYRGAAYDFISASTGAPLERRADDHLHARHQARAHRGARAADAGEPGQGARRQGVERRQPRRADRPHPVRPARAGRDGALPRRHDRDGDRARQRHRRAAVGSARHRRRPSSRAATRGRGRSAASCSGSCARATSAPRPSDADADGSILVIGEPMLDEVDVPAAAGRARRGDRRRGAADRRAGRRRRGARARADERQRRRAQHHQRAVRAAVPHRPRRRPRRAGARRRRRPLRRHLPRRGRGEGDADGARARLPQLLPPRRARRQVGARAVRPRRVRRQPSPRR